MLEIKQNQNNTKFFFNKSKMLPTAQGVQGGSTSKCYIITKSRYPLKDQPRKETKTYKVTGVSISRYKNKLKPTVLISAIKKNSA